MTTPASPAELEPALRVLLAAVGRLGTDPATLAATDDLYAAGLSSLATVDLMLAIEDEFGIEFPQERLNRRTFSSIGAMAEAVAELTQAAA